MTPALALIEEIKKNQEDWEIHYFGRKYALEKQKTFSYEYQLFSKNKEVVFHRLITGKLKRKFRLETIISLFKIPFGFLQSFYYLIKIRPQRVVSFGGFLSVPVVFNSWLLGIPSYTHEQTSTLGLANKINSFFVKRVAVSFPQVKKLVPKNKGVLTGNLIAESVYKSVPSEESRLYKTVASADRPILFITGGKTGSRIINQTIEKALPQLKDNFFIIHQIGLDKQQTPKRENRYWAIRFIDNKYFGWTIKNSDLVISRSGANIIFYLASFKQPAILIPIPWASQNEQYNNADFLRDTGLAKILKQSDLTADSLVELIKSFDYQDVQPVYPDWWERADPKGAAKRFWSIIKMDYDF